MTLPGVTSLKIFLLAVMGSLLSFSSKAQGDLQIFPKRIVFDGSKKSQELSLANSGKDTARYVISMMQIRMKEDGSFEAISQPDSGQLFADKNIRFFPRSVVLAPNEAQTIKMQLVRYSELTAGEYRSHIYFRAEPEKKALGEERRSGDSSAISVRLVPVFGISIPVIIRVGDYTTSASLSDTRFRYDKDSIPTLDMNLNRKGSMSIYGDVSVDYVLNDGKAKRVANVKGIALYSPNNFRRFSLALDNKNGIDYRKGSLKIVFANLSGPTVKTTQETVFLH
jgi:hypothetical protein